MAEFTSGEWKALVDGEDPIRIVSETRGKSHYSLQTEICELTKISKIPVLDFDGISILQPGSMEANARLLAAAPKMYEQLIRVLAHFDSGPFLGETKNPCFLAGEIRSILASI